MKTPSLLLLSFLFFSCQSSNSGSTTRKLFEYIQKEDYESAKALFIKRNDEYFAPMLEKKLKETHDLIGKYGIPPEDKWIISHTGDRSMSAKTYKIELHKGTTPDDRANVFLEVFYFGNESYISGYNYSTR